MKLNILFEGTILKEYFYKTSDRSGVFFSSYNILKELLKKEELNIVISFNYNHKKYIELLKNDNNLKNAKYIVRNLHDDKNKYINNINIHKNDITNKKSDIMYVFIKLLKIFKNCLLLLIIFFLKQKNEYIDLLNKINIYLSPIGIIDEEIKENKLIKKYIILYDIMPLMFPEYYPSYFLTDDHYNEFIRLRNVNKEYYYFCISENTKKDFINYYKSIIDVNKVFVTHIASAQKIYPINDKKIFKSVLKKYKIKYNDIKKYIFSLCTLEPRKNLIFTIKCFIKFINKNNIQDLYFYLGGGQWNYFIKELEQQIDNLIEYRDKIIKLGYVEDEDINILYSNSLFFTYISQYEGFGMPPLEAMQAGTPVITSNNSSLPEVVGDAAIMIDYNSEEQCIKAFEDLYFNEDLRNEYISKGLERAKLFSWEKTVNKMSEVILNKYL